jgi:hypothetical protein
MAVGHDPQAVGGVGVDLDERRAPVGVPQVEVPLVRHGRLAPKAHVGMRRGRAGRGLVHPAPPHLHPLLGLAHEHHPGSALGRRCQLIGAGEGFFVVASTEPHHRHLVVSHEPFKVGHHAVVVVAQQCRRRDVALPDQRRPVQQELHQAALVLQRRDVAGHADAIHGADPERDVLGQ